MRSLSIFFAAFTLFSSLACSRSESGRDRTIRQSIDLWSFTNFGAMIFDSVPLEDMRGIHLAGAGLVNRDVMISGRVEMEGTEGTYIVLSDQSARMLVDTTRVSAITGKKIATAGKTVIVHGEVKSGEKGHIYLMANAIRGG
jgi:hypothetical protein